MVMKPEDIERRSMEIIESELTVTLDEEVKPVVKRVIHATADFSFAESLHFTPGVVGRMRSMLSGGATVITDTNMALAGISKAALQKLGARALCLMADEDVPETAFSEAHQTVNLALPGGARCNIKCGPGVLHKVNNKTRQTVDEPGFMLDVDVYMDGNIEMSHTAAGLNIVHTHADNIFRGAITDTLHEAMEPQEI